MNDTVEVQSKEQLEKTYKMLSYIFALLMNGTHRGKDVVDFKEALDFLDNMAKEIQKDINYINEQEAEAAKAAEAVEAQPSSSIEESIESDATNTLKVVTTTETTINEPTKD